MGIHWLTSFCTDHADAASEVVNLSEVARAAGPAGITLACDLLGFVYAAVEHVITSSAAGDVPSAHHCADGGEYSLVDRAVETLLQTLAAHHIRLIGLLDPAQGTDADFAAKLGTWKARFHDSILSTRLLEAYCGGTGPDPHFAPLPKLASAQVSATLRRYGGTVQVATGEADVRLVQLMESAGAYALTGNDSDFYVIAGARYIPLNCLLHPLAGDPLAPNATASLFDGSFTGDLRVRLFTPQTVARALQIPERRLPELAALCGNDFTGELVDKVLLRSSLLRWVSGFLLAVVWHLVLVFWW